MEFSIYVINATEYGKTGKEVGTWVHLPTATLSNILETIGATPTDNYIIMDAELPYDYQVDEYARLDYLNDLAGMVLDIENDGRSEWLQAYMDATGYSLEYAIDNFLDHSNYYEGMTMYDVARNLVQENADLPSYLDQFFDYEALADSLENDGYMEVDDGVIEIF